VVSQGTPDLSIHYEVAMPGTTTLLHLLATGRAPVQNKPNAMLLAKLLMESGAKLDDIDTMDYWEGWGNSAENYFQNTPLINAIVYGNMKFAFVYMEQLKGFPLDKRQKILNYKDKFCAGFHTALELAIRSGYCKLATQIVFAGADTNPEPFIYSYGGKSPLHMACMLYGYANRRNDKTNYNLELILTLLQYNADYTKEVSTSVYTKVGDSLSDTNVFLTPFDYMDVDLSGMARADRRFNFMIACDEPAYKPKKKGQIKHPFHEESCFIHDLSMFSGRQLQLREPYFNSREYHQQDKPILQLALLKRILLDHARNFPDSPSKCDDVNAVTTHTMSEYIDNLCSSEEQDWFFLRLQQSGLFFCDDRPLVPTGPDSIQTALSALDSSQTTIDELVDEVQGIGEELIVSISSVADEQIKNDLKEIVANIQTISEHSDSESVDEVNQQVVAVLDKLDSEKQVPSQETTKGLVSRILERLRGVLASIVDYLKASCESMFSKRM
jgi:hypothetical protein